VAEAEQFICTINNRTHHPLKVKSVKLIWGKFDDSPNFPPVEIPARHEQKAFRTSGRANTSSGTEGTVEYQIGDNPDDWIKIYWDVPWLSGAPNHVRTQSFNEDVSVELDGFSGHGTVEDVTIKVVDGRG
jgi:hypothetical protein